MVQHKEEYDKINNEFSSPNFHFIYKSLQSDNHGFDFINFIKDGKDLVKSELENSEEDEELNQDKGNNKGLNKGHEKKVKDSAKSKLSLNNKPNSVVKSSKKLFKTKVTNSNIFIIYFMSCLCKFY